MAIAFRMIGDIGDPPPKAWLVPGWFGAGDVVLARGKPKGGKSTLIALLAAAAGGAGLWLNRAAGRGAVLWIAAERADDTTRNLFAVIDDDNAPIAIAAGAVDLTKADTAGDLIAACRRLAADTRLPVVLVVIDTLSRCIAGADENSAKEMSLVMATLNAVASEIGATIVVLHHTTKTGGTRGSTAIDAAVDAVIEVAAEQRGHSVEVVSMSAAPPGEKAWFAIEPARNGLKAVPIDAQGNAPDRLGPKSRKLIELISEVATDGQVTRRDLLQTARDRKIVEGSTAGEALRKLLRTLSDAKLISYDTDTVFIATEEHPTLPTPRHTPLRGVAVGGGVAAAVPHVSPTFSNDRGVGFDHDADSSEGAEPAVLN